jgi:hypothetical protein
MYTGLRWSQNAIDERPDDEEYKKQPYRLLFVFQTVLSMLDQLRELAPLVLQEQLPLAFLLRLLEHPSLESLLLPALLDWCQQRLHLLCLLAYDFVLENKI